MPEDDVVGLARRHRHIALLEKVTKREALTPAEIRELEIFEGEAKNAKDVAGGKQKAAEHPGIVRTRREVAKVFTVTVRTVANWLAEGAPGKQGCYPIAEIAKWREAQNARTQAKDAADPDTREFWEREFRKAKTQIARLEYRRVRGELVEKSIVERGRVERVNIVKNRLRALPGKFAQFLVGLTAQEIGAAVDAEVRIICEDFSGAGTVRKEHDEGEQAEGRASMDKAGAPRLGHDGRRTQAPPRRPRRPDTGGAKRPREAGAQARPRQPARKHSPAGKSSSRRAGS